MSYKSNKIGNIHNRLNLEGNVTYMGEEESNGSFFDTWARFPNIYDSNHEYAMTFMTYCRPEGWNMTIMTFQG